MFKLTNNLLTLSFSKDPDAVILVHKQLSQEFSTFGTPVKELLEDPNIIISHLIFKGAVVYCSINRLQKLADEELVCNFSFAYLHPFFRTLGLGKNFFIQRMNYCLG